MTITIRTNNVPRDVIEAYELTEKERQEFDYLDWKAIDAGEDGASFFRFKRQLYNLGEFILPSQYEDKEQSPFKGWDGMQSDSYFSGVLVRIVDDGERVVVGKFFS